jgi:hypothetical protein
LKKLDMHLHTIPTFSDSPFEFSMVKMREYVKAANLDAIAITNHNLFDLKQFEAILENLDICVFPGIEVNLESGHILIIANSDDPYAFRAKCDLVTAKISKHEDYLTVNELKTFFGNLHDYLVIPHYEKNPSLRADVFANLEGYFTAGEVDSPKKFVRAIKDKSKITPVLFSDLRISIDMANYSTRQTFVDCGDLSLTALKACFCDKGKVALSETEGNRLFQIFDNGQKLSTGLNVLLGERSSGKSHTLNAIYAANSNSTKYIEQFSLVQTDEAVYEKKFNDDIAKRRSLFAEEYLGPFKTVLNDILYVDLDQLDKSVGKYVESLLQSADEVEKKDAFSKMALFDETLFKTSDDPVLNNLIGSVRQLIENIEYRPIIEKYLEIESLKKLACELIEIHWVKNYERKKKKLVNELVQDIKDRLKLRTSATQVEDVDLYSMHMATKRVGRFIEITSLIQKETVISEENVQGFKIVATKASFEKAGDIKSVCAQRASFTDAFKKYGQPYRYLQALKENSTLIPSEFYKYFVKIEYEILNRDGCRVSGGERSEFRLLQEIKDAQKYDMLLIDEPESSFDNMFLNMAVNQMIKEISETMPVVVVTHNNTVGATIKPDYLLYACKERCEHGIFYKLYSGYPTDKELLSCDGKRKRNLDITLNSLEAGNTAYSERRKMYESIEN